MKSAFIVMTFLGERVKMVMMLVRKIMYPTS